MKTIGKNASVRGGFFAFLIMALGACSGVPSKPTVVVSPSPAEPPPAVASGKYVLPSSAEQVRLDALSARFDAGSTGPFARKTAPQFSTFVLSNGIPVVLKKNTASPVQTLSLVFRGGALMVTPEEAGIENVMLRTMARASESMPYAEVMATLDRTSSSISCGANLDYAICNLGTLDRYFDSLLPIFGSVMTTPAWNPEDYDFVLSEARLSLQQIDQDPWAKLTQVMNQEYFADHPYGPVPEGTEVSLSQLTLDKVRAFHDRMHSANRMFVVAVGNFDPASLASALEKAFGGIPDRKIAILHSPPPFSTEGMSRLIRHEFPASEGVGYLRGRFAAPAPEDPDFPALSLGLNMLSDLLFNVVRDRYGAVYSSSAALTTYRANYGGISVFKTTVASEVKAYVDEAIAELASGRVLSTAPRADEGTMPRQTIAEAIGVYKARYINAAYSDISTGADVAGLVAHSVFHYGDPRAWLLDVDRIETVQPEDVLAAVKKWLINGGITWVALGSNDVIAPLREEDFQSLRIVPESTTPTAKK